MIGNDVVDLRLARSQSNWQRTGFLEKVFTSCEQQVIRRAGDKDRAVWLMWSMKEAAYKAHQRRFGLPRKLNWNSLECRVGSFRRSCTPGVVTIDEILYYSFSRVTAEVIHTFAAGEKNLPVRSRLLETGSREIREKLLAEMAMLLGLPKRKISLVKDPQGIPHICLRDTRFHSPFSLSGHGRFGAFSVPLTNC